MTRPVRIAVLGLRGVPDVIGGVEAHCERLYPGLAVACPDLEFWLLSRRRFTAPTTRALGRAKVQPLWAPKSSALEAAVHTVLALFYARFWLGARSVHIHGIGPGFFAPLAKILGMETVVTHHARDYARPKWGPFARRFLIAGEGLVASSADKIVCVSEAVRTEFLHRHPDAAARSVTITHGVPELPSPSADEAGVLERLGLKKAGYALAVGRLDETKCFHDLIAAATLGDDASLPVVIVGSSVDGSAYADELQRSAGAKVIFAGDRYGGELAALYQGAALLIHPSEMEGFGLVILEALSLGTPVFVSDIPAHREFALPEQAYFAVGDIGAISRGLLAPAEILKTAEVSNSIRERYSAASAIDAHAQIFRAFV